ncbi:MAG: Nramp family divalent metal transporter [bacterium]|nr:Nramp family divalent metal transporter [bacterium]
MSKEFPETISLTKMLGPSFIILALGLGSGEVILWPLLSSNYGLGIAWGALLGITFQFFMNMEIERYALVKGESVFVGMNRIWRWAPWWFIISTFIGFGLPGIIASSATTFAYVFGFESHEWIAIIFLITIGLIISMGKTVYDMMEKVTRTIIFLGIPFILILTFFVAKGIDWSVLAQGLMGIGDGYRFLPKDPEVGFLALFLGAFAYAGAGGNLNLTQSIYIREKGYGMGKYSQKIAGLFQNAKKEQKVKLAGENFKADKQNIKRFNEWWKLVNTEHLMIFWFLGALAMSLLMLLAYATTYGMESNATGIQFVINEGVAIGAMLAPIVGTIFLLVVSIMLFQTQLGIMDSTSRIMSENLALKKLGKNTSGKIHLSKIYFLFLWAQVIFGILLFLLDLAFPAIHISEPKFLLILGAVINAFAMFVHVGLVNWMNFKTLEKPFQAAIWRKLIMSGVFVFFGIFSVIVFWDKFF